MIKHNWIKCDWDAVFSNNIGTYLNLKYRNALLTLIGKEGMQGGWGLLSRQLVVGLFIYMKEENKKKFVNIIHSWSNLEYKFSCDSELRVFLYFIWTWCPHVKLWYSSIPSRNSVESCALGVMMQNRVIWDTVEPSGCEYSS